MARQLDGVDDLIRTTTLPSTATDNITFGGWFYFDSLATDSDVTIFNGDTALNGYGLYYTSSEMRLLLGGINSYALGVTISSGAWTHLTLRRSSTTWQIYKNGAATGSTNTTTPNAPSGGSFQIGDDVGRDSQNLQKRVADVFFHTSALSVDEIAALGNGYSPLSINPGNLVLYWPLIGRYSPEIELKSGNSATITGATTADHPRIIYPKRNRTVVVPDVVVASTDHFLTLLGVGA